MLCRLQWLRVSDKFGLGVCVGVWRRKERKRMGIILKQMSCCHEPHKMAMTVCVNYTTLLLAAAAPRVPTTWSCSPLRMLSQSEGDLQGIYTVQLQTSSPISKSQLKKKATKLLEVAAWSPGVGRWIWSPGACDQTTWSLPALSRPIFWVVSTFMADDEPPPLQPRDVAISSWGGQAARGITAGKV